MAKQMLIDAYRGKMTPSPPWVPYSGVHSAFLIDQPAETFLQDPKIMAKGVVAAGRAEVLFAAALVNALHLHGNEEAELILTQDKGYRPDGQRHPHSWSIVDEEEMVGWLLGLF